MIPIAALPETAASASEALREALVGIFGDDLTAMWLYGGTTFDDRSRQSGDLDICVVLGQVSPSERRPEDWLEDPFSRPRRLVAITQSIEAEFGVNFDTACFLENEMSRDEPPDSAFWERRRHTGWPIDRAHWLGGQYVHLHGRRPEELVVAPSRAALMVALDRELEHLERHVYEGDAEDPYEATYAVFNGCRILQTLETGSSVLSKRSGGAWALEHLPETWHAVIRAAGRAYDGSASEEDKELLRANMAPFVAMVRERLPVTSARPPGPPRWS
jgi:predicted nucleotidyltransferase